MNLPEYVENLINILRCAGESAYAVGGCVRDIIMGREPNDFDMTTSALPEKTQKIFEDAGFRTIPTGIKHGTVSVILGSEIVEITTFRIDGEYNDSRHPDSVTFTRRVEDDLARRDFTVNAMAYNDKEGLIDVFGGRADIERKLIRAVGLPQKRFEEDALRILRAARFACVLGFDIDDTTFAAMQSKRNGLSAVSRERIRVEFEKILVCERAKYGLDIMEKSGILKVIFPTLEFSRSNETENKISVLPPDFELRLAYLLSDSSEKTRTQVISSLKLSSTSEKKVFLLLDAVLAPLPNPNDGYSIRKYLRTFNSQAENSARLRALKENADASKILDAIAVERSKNPCLELSSLKISGSDLIALGITDGRNIGEILSLLLDKVIEQPQMNEKTKLCTLATKIHTKRNLK